jgi:hypothetical protein
VPNMKHADMIATPEALQAVVGAISPQQQRSAATD